MRVLRSRVLLSCLLSALLPGLPAGAAFTLFAVGRVVGWIAHAMEQGADGRLIRPRARYIGEYETPPSLPVR